MIAKVYSRLYSIFNKKKWPRGDDDDQAFEALSVLLGNVGEEQQNLILELVDRYQWIRFNEIEPGVRELALALEIVAPDAKKLYIGPIISPGDEGEVKSGHYITYIIKTLTPRIDTLKNVHTKFIHSYASLDIAAEEYLVLVDDYIGSGGSVLSAIKSLITNQGIAKEKIIVLAFAAQREALKKLDEQHIHNYSYLTLLRGITDHYDSNTLAQKIDIMKKIEKLIPKLNAQFSFGFLQTEALITFNSRTPNNTFPIFWMKHKLGNTEYDAAFPRF